MSVHFLANFVQDTLVQIRTFGLFAGNRASKEDFDENIFPRVELLTEFVRLVERDIDIHSALQTEPFILADHDNKDNTPFSGYMSPNISFSPSAYLTSRTTFWKLQLQDDSHDLSVTFLLHGALLVLYQNDLFQSIRYTFDMLKYGWVLRPEIATDVILRLLWLRKRVSTDQEIISILIDEQSVSGPVDWSHARYRSIDGNQFPVIYELDAEFDYLIELIESDVRAVVNARSYDEWVSGQIYLSEAIGLARTPIIKNGVGDHLSYSSSLARLEEIQADAGGYVMMLSSSRGRFPYGANFAPGRFLLRLFQSKFADGADRLLDDRAVIPVELEDLFLSISEEIELLDALPGEWQQLSNMIAPVFAICIRKESTLSLASYRRNAFKLEEVQHGNLALRFCQEKNITQENVLLDLLYLLGVEFPETGPVSARKQANDRLLGNGLSSETITELTGKLGCYLLIDELRYFKEKEVHARVQAKDLGEAAALREQILKLYPYFHHYYLEEAIALDESKKADEALHPIVKAILIDPLEHMRWHSFAVILLHSGYRPVAIAAETMSRSLEAPGR